MTWAHDAASATIYDVDTDEVICRDVDPQFGALIAAATEMRDTLIKAAKIHDLLRTRTARVLAGVLAATEPGE